MVCRRPAIARKLGISRTTVMKAVTSVGPPRYVRGPSPTSFTPFEFRVRALLAETPDMPATVLAERVGWTGSIRWFRDNVNRVRAEHRPIDPADRLSWSAGDVAQCDLWFPPRKILLEDGSRTMLPVLVMTAAHSRFMLGRMIPTRKTPDLLLGSWELLTQLGRVPRRLIWDNEPGIGRGKPTEPVAVFAGTLATKIVLLPPKDPESKGVVERRNGFFETSFMPGPALRVTGRLQPQFTDWLTTANTRLVRTLKARPVDLVEVDRAAMLPLPPAVLHLGWRNHVRLGRDYYVRVDTNDYSVDPRAIGARVDVTADLDAVRVRHGGRLVAEHPRRWARGHDGHRPRPCQRRRRAAPRLPAPDHPARGGGPGPRPGRLRQSVRHRRRADDGPADEAAMTPKTVTTETLKQITHLAAALKAPRITESAARLADHARDAGWTHEDYLAAVLEREVAARNASGAQLRIRAAGHARGQDDRGLRLRPPTRRPHPDPGPGLRGLPDRAPQRRPPRTTGTGKTHLATALGIAACRQGHRVLFATATDWVARLCEAHERGRLAAELTRLRRYGLIIVDEVGYLPFDQDAANLFFQLVSSRYEHASLILTSNLPFSSWAGVFGDQVVAAAMIDRIVHHADVIALKGASYRLRDRGVDTLPSIKAEQESLD